MQVGIIAEGWSDVAVIRNILKGWLGIDKSETRPLLPENQTDETSRHEMRRDHFSNWTLVKQSCLNGEHHTKFLEIQEEEHFVIVHLDTDMRKEIGFDVHLPESVEDQAGMQELIGNVEGRLREWLRPEFAEKTVLAIAVQETEAWVLTVYSDHPETGHFPAAKEQLQKEIKSTNLLSKKEKQEILRAQDRHVEYSLLSYGLRKRKYLEKATKQNLSLAHFCNQLEAFRPTED